MDLGVAFADDLQGCFPLFMSIFPGDVEPIPVKGDLLPEVGSGSERRDVEELVFDQSVYGFDIALPGVGLYRDIVMFASE